MAEGRKDVLDKTYRQSTYLVGDLSPQSRLVLIAVDSRVSLCSDLGFAASLSEVGFPHFKMGVMIVLSL